MSFVSSESYDFRSLFPGVELLLQDKSNQVDLARALNGNEVVGIYFSAHWCGPCRHFTPILSRLYNELKALGKSFEIVFVSSDRNDDAFHEYFKEMPWLAIPFAEQVLRDKLEDIFECRGIPKLVLLDGKNGEVISLEGKSKILSGSLGFPFTDDAINIANAVKEKKIEEVFSNWTVLKLYDVDIELLKSKEAVAIVFGNASNGLKYILPALAKAYTKLYDRLAVVYVTHELDEINDDEKQLQDQMPTDWIKLNISQSKQLVTTLNDTTGYLNSSPMLLVTRGDGSQVLSLDAINHVYRNGALGFPWSPKNIKEALDLEEKKLNNFKSETFHVGGLKFLKDGRFISHNENESDLIFSQLLNHDLVGLYFSAHWCGPCRKFTPELIEQYNLLKEGGKKVEIVFISSDKDESSFTEYYNTMPWTSLDYKLRDLKGLLSSAFSVTGIPTLIWVDPKTGRMVEDGRLSISYGHEYFPWTPEQMEQGKVALEETTARKRLEAKQRADAVADGFRAAKTVVLRNHIGKGEILPDYTVTFTNFNTFIGEVKLSNGKFYYEIEVLKPLEHLAQFGWMTEGFVPPSEHSQGSGVGDDNFSWGFDGARKCKWGNSSSADFGSAWTHGDVLGLAVDLGAAKSVSFSVNGDFTAPFGVAFEGIAAEWVSPALTADVDSYRINFGDRPFKFSPPDVAYKSVHTGLSV